MQCVIQLTDLMIKSITWLFFVMLIHNPISSSISSKLLRSSSKFLSPHGNDILIATRNPECDDSHHQTKILILPVFVPHSRKEPEVEIMNMNQFNSPYSFKAKKNKKNQWKESATANEDKETQFSLAKFLENPKANYIFGNDLDLNQAGLLTGGKLGDSYIHSGGDEGNSRGGEGLTLGTSGGSNDGSEMSEGKMPLLTELIVKSVLAGQKNYDWDYVASNASPTHTSPETVKNSTNTPTNSKSS